MQIKRISFAILTACAAMPLMAQTAVPAVPAYPVVQPAPVQAAAPADKWLERMGDFTQNASAFKDPRTFNQWFGAMTDPSMVTSALPMMMEPGTWIRTTSSVMQPAAIGNYMGFTDPNVYGRWMGAMMDPNFYMQNAFSMADPGKMMRWMMLPMDPKMMQAGMSMMNPNTYMKWMMAPMDPRVWGLMFAPMNPQLYGSMAGAVINPQSMPSAWQTFMNPKYPVVSLSPAAPLTVPINVLDPSTWGNMLGMFGGFFPGFPAMSGAAQAPAAAPVMQLGVPTKLSLAGDTLFKIGKSAINDLTDEGKARLDKLAADIKAAGKIDTIRVVGHADKTGKASANMTLSQRRASAVASYLKAQGVTAGKFITAGKGDSQPVVQCDAKLAKADLIACNQPNRRVEVEVTVAK